jgi:biopolymer transport protein ExbD
MIRTKRPQFVKMISDINITPFTDVCLVLLIIFMVTATFLTQNMGLNIALPKATSSQQLPPREVTIWVNKAGQIKVDEAWVTPRDLISLLQQKLGAAQVRAVTIRGDERVPYGTVVTIMDAATRLGADITLAAEVDAGPPGGR